MDNRFITIKDTDVDILNRLSIVDLYHTCHVNRYTLDVCQQDAQLNIKLYAYTKALSIINDAILFEMSDDYDEFSYIYMEKDFVIMRLYPHLFPLAAIDPDDIGDPTSFYIYKDEFYISSYYAGEDINISKNDMINIVATHLYVYPFIDIVIG